MMEDSYVPPYTSPLAQEDPVIRSQKFYDKIFGGEVRHYEKTFNDKEAYDRYLDKNDDEYWNDYVNVRTGESVGNLEEALSEQERLDEYRITVSKTDDNRVNINMSRSDALRLMEDIGAGGNSFLTLSGTLRSLLRTFFVNNEDITSEDSYY